MNNCRLLIVDDDNSLRQVLTFQLREIGCVVETCESAIKAQKLIEDNSYDVVLTDMKMPRMSGLELLKWIKEHVPDTQVIVLTAHGTIDEAVEAMKIGAFDFLTKPINRDELRLVVKKAFEHAKLVARVQHLEKEVSEKFGKNAFVYRSSEMADVISLTDKVTESDATVLITGESGTGKELIAKMIHYHSARRSNSLVTINCAAIPKDLLESELFGHTRGAFTGAVKERRGKFEEADGGTLFLDEIGEMPLELQAKLLRVLETKEIDVIGHSKPRALDVRILAATNRDLHKLVDEGKFREDLFFRLDVIQVHIPPLRDRPVDIPPLAEHFFQTLSGGVEIEVDADVYDHLQRRKWKGNVRELRNVCERMLILRKGNRIGLDDIPQARASRDQSKSNVVNLPREGYSFAQIEEEAVRQALAHAGGNKAKASELLQIPRHILVYRMKKYGIEA